MQLLQDPEVTDDKAVSHLQLFSYQDPFISYLVHTWGVQVLRSPNFFSRGMEADRNVKVVGGDVALR